MPYGSVIVTNAIDQDRQRAVEVERQRRDQVPVQDADAHDDARHRDRHGGQPVEQPAAAQLRLHRDVGDERAQHGDDQAGGDRGDQAVLDRLRQARALQDLRVVGERQVVQGVQRRLLVAGQQRRPDQHERSAAPPRPGRTARRPAKPSQRHRPMSCARGAEALAGDGRDGRRPAQAPRQAEPDRGDHQHEDAEHADRAVVRREVLQRRVDPADEHEVPGRARRSAAAPRTSRSSGRTSAARPRGSPAGPSAA